MQKSGFTILELVVVIIILGILAALALPGFGKAKESAFEKEAQTNLRLISAAEKIYRLENNAYFPINPTTIDTDTGLATINSDLKLSLIVQNWNYKIISGAGFTAKAQRTADTTKVLCVDQTNEDPHTAGCGAY